MSQKVLRVNTLIPILDYPKKFLTHIFYKILGEIFEKIYTNEYFHSLKQQVFF